MGMIVRVRSQIDSFLRVRQRSETRVRQVCCGQVPAEGGRRKHCDVTGALDCGGVLLPDEFVM